MLALRAIPMLLAASAIASPEIRVTGQSVGPVDPRIFGAFLEKPTFSDETGPEAVCDDSGRLPASAIEKIRAIAPPVVRFPGGTAVDYDDWTDLISNAPGRADPARPITKGYRGGEYTNRFGLDAFLALSEQLRFQPLLAVNLRDALYRKRPLRDAALHAAGMIAYCTRQPGDAPEGMPDWGGVRAKNGRPSPTRIPLVAVGNEAWFYWPPKPEEREALGIADDNEAVARHVEALVAYADAIHAVDPAIELIADGPQDPWHPEFAPANALRARALLHPEVRKRYTYAVHHQYFPMAMGGRKRDGKDVAPGDLSDDEVWYGLQGGPGILDPEGRNVAYGDSMAPYTAAGYRVALTEWNWNGWNVRNTVGDRPFTETLPAMLSAAAMVHGLARRTADAAIANQSMLLGHSWRITAVRVLPGKDPFFMPQGHVMAFYARSRGDRLLATAEHDIPWVRQPVQFAGCFPAAERLALVDAIALATPRGTALWIVHRKRDASTELAISWEETVAAPAGTAEIRHLTGDPASDMGASEALRESSSTAPSANCRATITLPPASVTTVLLPPVAAK